MYSIYSGRKVVAARDRNFLRGIGINALLLYIGEEDDRMMRSYIYSSQTGLCFECLLSRVLYTGV